MPPHSVDPWHLLEPRQAWAIVVVIAGLGFFNYVMLRLFGTRGVYYAAFLGGLVNSTAAAADVIGSVFDGRGGSFATRGAAADQCSNVYA
jgi:uncharacterized membrane protein (DUF4010 family)